MKISLDLTQLIQVHSNTCSHGAYPQLLKRIVPVFIQVLLQHTHGNKSAAARIAGFNRATLNSKIKQYDIVIEKKVILATKGDV